jgi:hypothetical protein
MDASKISTQEQKQERKEEQKPSQEQQESGVKKVADDVKAKFEHFTAMPGPVIPQDFDAKEEGTKEERLAKAEALNK